MVKTSFISAVSVLLDICMRGFSLTVLKIMTHRIGYDHNTPVNKLKQVMGCGRCKHDRDHETAKFVGGLGA